MSPLLQFIKKMEVYSRWKPSPSEHNPPVKTWNTMMWTCTNLQYLCVCVSIDRWRHYPSTTQRLSRLNGKVTKVVKLIKRGTSIDGSNLAPRSRFCNMKPWPQASIPINDANSQRPLDKPISQLQFFFEGYGHDGWQGKWWFCQQSWVSTIGCIHRVGNLLQGVLLGFLWQWQCRWRIQVGSWRILGVATWTSFLSIHEGKKETKGTKKMGERRCSKGWFWAYKR